MTIRAQQPETFRAVIVIVDHVIDLKWNSSCVRMNLGPSTLFTGLTALLNQPTTHPCPYTMLAAAFKATIQPSLDAVIVLPFQLASVIAILILWALTLDSTKQTVATGFL